MKFATTFAAMMIGGLLTLAAAQERREFAALGLAEFAANG